MNLRIVLLFVLFPAPDTGIGLWQLSNDGEITTAQDDWQVETTKPWMNLLTPIARPLFKWNHNVVMSWGAEGWARELGTPSLASR